MPLDGLAPSDTVKVVFLVWWASARIRGAHQMRKKEQLDDLVAQIHREYRFYSADQQKTLRMMLLFQYEDEMLEIVASHPEIERAWKSLRIFSAQDEGPIDEFLEVYQNMDPEHAFYRHAKNLLNAFVTRAAERIQPQFQKEYASHHPVWLLLTNRYAKDVMKKIQSLSRREKQSITTEEKEALNLQRQNELQLMCDMAESVQSYFPEWIPQLEPSLRLVDVITDELKQMQQREKNLLDGRSAFHVQPRSRLRL